MSSQPSRLGDTQGGKVSSHGDSIGILACLGLVVLVGCGASPGPPPAAGRNDAALADTLKARIAEAYDFSRPGVAERMEALYPDTGRVISASGGAIPAPPGFPRGGNAT